MKRLWCAVVLTNVWYSAVQAWAVDTSSVLLAPGDYTVSVMPPFNRDTAGRIEDRVALIQGVEEVDAHYHESTLRFTVKDNTEIDSRQVRQAVESVDTGAVISVPVLTHAYNANLGL